MSDLFLFVRPPRPLWPFNGPGSAFWPPLAFASMAAALREQHPDLRVAILDAPALRMGWKSLTAEIERLRPGYIGLGEEAVSCAEGLRMAALAKESGARVIAGGCFFANVAAEALKTSLIDVVVHGEGEETIVELVSALRDANLDGLKHVRGITFREGEQVIRTEPRLLMADLDRLPIPAYDLLPMQRYGRYSRNHAGLAAIELSRGCSFACDFCILWRQMGEYRADRISPRVRAKSPERVLEEIQILMDRYGRRFLGWVDPCFNADPNIPRRLAELLLQKGRRIDQSAWVRADYLVRDEASGALRACAEAGLREVYIGIERVEKAGLRALHKGNLQGEPEQALQILARKYPQVLTVGSFIYGLAGDTPDSIRSMFRGASRLPLDMSLFIPLTPLPGTPFWKPENWESTGQYMRELDFLPHVDGNTRLAQLTMALYRCTFFHWTPQRLHQLFRGFLARDHRRRSIGLRHFARAFEYSARGVAAGLLGHHGIEGMRIPRWYNT